MQDMRVRSLGQEKGMEKEMAAQFQYSCLENPMDSEAPRLQSMQSQKELAATEQQQKIRYQSLKI